MVKTYTVSEAAALLGVHKVTIQRNLSKGNLKYVQIGNGWRRIPESEIQRIIGD